MIARAALLISLLGAACPFAVSTGNIATMDNVIRPSFGARPQPANSKASVYEEGYQPLHVYGQAAGYLVALIEDASGPEGLVLKVVVGPVSGNSIEAVAFFLASDEGRIDADATANAILRALEVVEGDRAPKPA